MASPGGTFWFRKRKSEGVKPVVEDDYQIMITLTALATFTQFLYVTIHAISANVE